MTTQRMIRFQQKGNFSKLTKFLERAKEAVKMSDLDKYGREGVAALSAATPVDTGKTSLETLVKRSDLFTYGILRK